MSNLEWITKEIRARLTVFRKGTEPSPLIISDNIKVEFLFELCPEDYIEDDTAPLLNRDGYGLQIHEYLNDNPYSYTNDEDELEGGWVVIKEGTLDETAASVALQICADFDLC